MLLSIAAACGVFCALRFPCGWGTGWSVTAATVSFMGLQAWIGVKMRKRIMAAMGEVQAILAEGQKKLQAKIQRWQMRPPGSMQFAQKELFNDMAVFVREAIAKTDELRRFRLWVPMIDRQMATAKLQLHWMVKEFDKADACLKKAILADPSVAAMKMARMYMLGAPTAEMRRLYEKKASMIKRTKNPILHACYSWVLVKRNEIDEAFKVLTDAVKYTDSQTIKANHGYLMNNKPERFTNSTLGDQWFALHLEEPKMRAQRQHPVYR